jgi:hypothetical protein
MPTFQTCDVVRGKPFEALDPDASIRSLLLKPVEAFSCDATRLVSCDTQHALAKAAQDAFYLHHPLTLRPDDVWFCIMQGLAHHIGQNTEALRGRIVAHEGKKKLLVTRLDFFLGQPNPWPEAFAAFSAQIGTNVGALRELVSMRFSTSTPTEVAAFDVCLMDAFQGYFEYEMMAGCGIPEFTVLGTEADWQSIRTRIALLRDYDLGWWVDVLDPVVARIAETAAGHVDTEFWRSFFRYQSGSGPAELTGWIVTLFPYLTDSRRPEVLARNTWLSTWQERFRTADARGDARLDWDDVQGPGIGLVPGSLASAPVRFVDVRDNSETDLRFIAGMFGVDQDPAIGALAPAFGWAVVYDVPASPPPRKGLIDFDIDLDETTGAKRAP